MLKNYNNTQIRPAQQKLLCILQTIDKICRQHNIPYWLDGGTLLGAVRHKGFIPWDDDVDIAMTQADMERFIQVAPSLLPAQYELQTLHNGRRKAKCPVKVRDRNSILLEPNSALETDKACGVFVDIFPFIPYPTVSRRFAKITTKNIQRIYSTMRKYHSYSLRNTLEPIWKAVKWLLASTAWGIARLMKRKGVFMGYTLNINWFGIMHLQSNIYPLKTIDFEGCSFYSPANPEAYLTEIYGNYMEIPPKEKQRNHSLLLIANLMEHVEAYTNE